MVAPVFAGSCPSGFSSPVSVVPVYADYLKGSSGDGHSMSASCFTMTLNGFDPTITPQSPLYICPGNPVTLTSSPAASYQWYYNGNILSGEVNQNLTVNLPGYYTVKITNINNCYAWSFPATVLSGTTPVFTLNPQDTYVCPGDNANFLVVVSGATTYQWQESNDGGLNWYNLIDNSTYSGTQTDYLQIMNVTFSMNNYLYRCVVTAGCSGISSVATLSVGSPPVITKHPIDTTVCPGAPVSFTVLSSTYNTTYQWYENQGSGWVMLSNTGVYNDVTTNTLTISNTTGMNGYQYMCVLTTCSYIVNSNIATLSQYPYNTWLGFTSDWNISNNWTCGIPSPSSDVIIPSSPMGNYFPMIFSNNVATCRDIIISPGANLTINTGADLTVYGDWDNGGLPNIGLGKIIFAGTSQVVKGTNNFNNITINNGSTVTLMSSGQALAGILLCNGVLNTNDYLTLLSNASGTALISGSSIGLVNGSVVQQRFIPAAKAKGYKHFSSAFSNAHIGQFSNFMTLYLGNTNSNPYPTIFKFSEADANPLFANGWIEAAPQGATNTIIPPGIGYTAQIGNNNNDITAYLYGEVNNGNIPVNVTRINPGPGKGDGWNLVGNPYPSPIDLDKLPYINSNLNRSVSIFISTSMYNGYYGYYNAVLHYALNGGTRYLSALHSFFVQCNNTAGGTLIFNNSMRSDMVNTQLYKNEIKPPYPHIKLKAMCSQTAYLSDETAIFLIPEATENFDPDYDVAKIMNTEPDMPNIFSLSKDNYLAINSLPFDLKKEIIIPIGYSTNKSGLNFIEATEISNIDNDIEIVLEDIAKNYSQNLKEKPLYTFDYIQGEASLGRLFLRIRPSDNASNNVTNINEPYNNTIFYVYSSDKTIFISYSDFYERKGKIELFDFNGKLVKKPQELSNGTHKLVCNDLPVGNYILKFVSEGLTKITKIFIE